MKKILIGLGLICGLVFTSNAAVTAAYTITKGWNPTNLISVGTTVQSITIQNPAATTNMTWALLDAPNWVSLGNPYYAAGISNGGYMVGTTYSSNAFTVIRTNWTGVLFTNTVNFVRTITNWVGGATNSYRVVLTGECPSNSTQTISVPAAGYPFMYGVSLTNTGNLIGTITITHNPML